MKSLSKFLVTTLALIGLASPAMAQLPGQIYFPPTVPAGRAILDPNGDGFASATSAGFTVNSMSGSEIPMVPIPQLYVEPSADLSTGPSGGHTDLIQDLGGDHSFIYNDGTNVFFRMILEGTSTASKGYTFLINTDFATWGTWGPNNPGFDFEVVLETNFQISVYAYKAATNKQTPVRVLSLPLNQYHQRAISYVHSGGTTGYFYDWYIPMASLTAALATEGITFNSSTPFRVATTTITRAQNGVTGSPLSDLGGVDDDLYRDPYVGFLDIIDDFPPVPLDDLDDDGPGFPAPLVYTNPPLVDGPVYEGATSVSGTLAEDPGATIFVYVDGVFVGTAILQADYTWELTGLAALSAGDEITAYAQSGTKELSDVSNTITVLAVGVAPPCPTPPTGIGPQLTTLGTPTIGTLGLHGGTSRIQSVQATVTGLDALITSLGAANVGVVIYQAGTTDFGVQYNNPGETLVGAFGATAFSSAAISRTGNTFTITTGSGNTGLRQQVPYELMIYTIPPALSGGKPTNLSARSAPFVGGTVTTTTAPTFVDTALYAGDTQFVVTNAHASAANIYLYVDGRLLSTASAVAASGTTTFSVSAIAQGDVYSVRAQGTAAGSGVSTANSITVSAPPAPPVITGSYEAGDTTVTGTTSLPNGTLIEVFTTDDPVTPIGTTTVSATPNWSATVTALVFGDTLYATATPANSVRGCASDEVVVATAPTQSDPPVITGTYYNGGTTVVGYSTEPAGTVIKVYVDGFLEPLTGVVDALGNWSVTVGALVTGEDITATATAPGETESALSNTVTVLSGRSTTPVLNRDGDRVAFAPNDYYTIASDSIFVTVPVGPIGIITVYVDDIAIGTYDATGEAVGVGFEIDNSELLVSGGDTPSLLDDVYGDDLSPTYITDEFYKGAAITVTNTSTGLGESLESNEEIVVGVDYFTIVLETPGPKLAGTCFDVIITAYDNLGNVFTEYEGQALLYSYEVLFTADSRLTPNFVAGVGYTTVCMTALYGAEDVQIRALDTGDPTTGGISEPFLIENPVLPTLTDINPDTKYQGEDTFTLTLTGTGFVQTSQVLLEGVVIPQANVTFISSTQLEVTVDASYLTDYNDDLDVAVQNPTPLVGGALVPTPTATLVLDVLQPPSPTIVSITNDQGQRCGTFTVTVVGTGFIQGVTELSFEAAVTVSDVVVTVPFDPLNPGDPTELTATISIDCAATLGLGDVVVTNPGAPVPSDTLTDGFEVLPADFIEYFIVLPGQTANIGPGNIITVSGSPSNQTAGTPFSATIYAVEYDGVNYEIYTGFTGAGADVDLSAAEGLTGVTISPTTSGNFTNGVWTGNLTLTEAGSITITAVNGQGTGTQEGSETVTIVAGAPAKYTVTVSDTTPEVGDTITVDAQLTDAYGNPVLLGGRNVTWSDVGGTGGSIDDTTDTTDANGQVTMQFTVSSVADVTHRLRALDTLGASGLSPVVTTQAAPITATKFIVVLPGETANITGVQVTSVTGTPDDQTAGVLFDVVKLYATDNSGNIANTYTGTKTITWTGATGATYTTSVTFFEGVSVTPLSTLITEPQSNVILNADDGTIDGDSSQFDVVAGPPGYALISGDTTEAAGEVSDLLTLTLYDSFGNATNALVNTTYDLTSTGLTGKFYSDAAGTVQITSVTITAGTGSVNFYYYGETAQVDTLSATWDSGGTPLGGDTHAFTITPGAPAGISLTPELGRTTTAGVASGAYTVTVLDAYGNTTNVSANTSVALTENSTGTVTFAGANVSGTTLTILSGTSSSTFTYTDTLAGTHTITATISGTPTDAGLTVADTDNAPVTITAGPPVAIELTPSAGHTTTAGVASSAYTVTTVDQYGNASAVTGDTTIALTENSTGTVTFAGANVSGTTLTILDGTSSSTFTYTDTLAGTHTITATVSTSGDGGLTGADNDTAPVTVTAAAPAGLTLTPELGLSTTAGTATGNYTVTIVDAYGNASNVSADTSVALTENSAGTVTFSTGTTLTVANGTSSTTFTYTDTLAGTHTITATISGTPTDVGLTVADTDNAPVTVTAGPPVAIELTPSAGHTTTAGVASSAYTVTTVDQYGNASAVTGDTTIALTENSTGTVTFAGANVSGTTLTILDGTSSSTFTYTDTLAGTHTITATVSTSGDGGLTGADNDTAPVTVTAAAPAGLTLTPELGLSTTAGTATGNYTVTIVDAYGNASNVSADTSVALTENSAGTVTFSTGTTLTVANGTSATTFTYTDTLVGTHTITATISGTPTDLGLTVADTDNAPVTVTAGAPYGISLTGPASVSAGDASTNFTLTVVDEYGNATNVVADTTFALTTTSGGTVTYNPTSPITVTAGSSSTTFTYTDTEAGLQTVTATRTGGDTLTDTNDDHAITVTPDAPVAIELTPSAGYTTAAGVATGAYTVTTVDQYGNASPVTGDTTLALTENSAGTVTFTGANVSGTTLTILDTTSSSTFTYTDTLVGTYTITATVATSGDAGLSGDSDTAPVTIIGGAPADITVSGPGTVQVNANSTNFTITVVDAYGNVATVGGGDEIIVNLTARGTSSFTSTPVTITGPATTGTFTFLDTATGDDVVITGTVDAASDAIVGATGTATIDVTGGPPVGFTLTGPSSTVVTVNSTAFTIQLIDAGGNPATVTGSVTVAITTENPLTGTITSTPVTITGPASSGTFVYRDTIIEADVTLTAEITAAASHPGIVGEIETADIDIIGGPPTQVTLSGPTSTNVNVDSTAITVSLLDANGYPATVTGSVEVTITTENAGTGTITTSPVTITGPANTGTFVYKDSFVENDVTLTGEVTTAASHPTLVGATGTHDIDIVNPVVPIASLSGSALSFGAGAYGETNLGDSAGLYADALTVEVWINRDAGTDPLADGGSEVIAANGTDWILRVVDSDGTAGVEPTFEFVTGGLTPNILAITETELLALGTPIDLFDGGYHHVSVVYDNGTDTKKIYIDGQLVKSVGVSGTIDDTSNVFRIAADADGAAGEFWNGAINEVRVWSVVRDEGQLNAAATTLLNGYEFGLEHYWRVDEGTGTLVNNEVSAADLTLFNSPTWEDPNSFSEILAITGLDTEIQLGGYDGVGGVVSAFITALPTSGKLYQRLANGDKGAEITAAMLAAGTGAGADPGEVLITDSLGRVIYEAAEPTDTLTDDVVNVEDLDALATFSYLVKSGGVSSAVETVTIDLEAASLLGGTAVLLNPPGAPTLFATTTHYVITPNLRAGFADNSVTIEAWFRADGPGILVNELGSTAIDKGWHTSLIEIVDADGVAGPTLGADNDAFVRVRVWNLPEATSTTLTTGLTIGSIEYGEWTHAAVRYNHLARRLDGALNGVPSGSSVSGDRQAPWETIVIDDWNRGARGAIYYGIGSRDRQHMGSGGAIGVATNNYFQGAVDEIRIWNEAIPDERLGAKYTQFIEGDDAKLVALYRFDEPNGTNVEDFKGGYDATIVGGAGRTRSTADLNLGEIVWGEEFTVEVPGYDNGNGGITARITRMPLAGAVYQVLANGTRGARITNVPTTVTDSRRRVIFVPATGSRSDSFEYQTTGTGDVFGTRRMRFRILRTNNEPTMNATGILGSAGAVAAAAATESTARVITHAELVAAFTAADADGDALTFRVEKVFNGSLTGPSGAAAVPMVTTVAPGQTLTWTPPAYVSAPAGSELAAFRVIATDGRDFSSEGTLKVEITAADDAPVATFPGTSIRLAGSGYAYTPNLRSVMRTDDLTIQVWFRADGPGVLVSERANATGTGWSNSVLEVVDDGFGGGQVKGRVWGVGNTTGITLGAIEYGRWYHAAISYNDSTREVYTYLGGPGVDSGSTFYDGSSRNAPWDNGFTGVHYGFGRADGQNLGSGAGFTGRIREVRVWREAIPSGQILTSYPGNLTGDEPALAAWYRFNEGTGTAIRDFGPFRLTSVTGTTVFGPPPGFSTSGLGAALTGTVFWVNNRPSVVIDEFVKLDLDGFDPDGTHVTFLVTSVPVATASVGGLVNYGELRHNPGGSSQQTISTLPHVVSSGHVAYYALSSPQVDLPATASFTYQVREADGSLSADATVTIDVVAAAGGGTAPSRDGQLAIDVMPRKDANDLVTVRATRTFSEVESGGFGEQVAEEEAPKLRFDFDIDRRARFVVEVSDDLSTWYPVSEVIVTDSETDAMKVDVSATVDALGGQRFIRVRLTP